MEYTEDLFESVEARNREYNALLRSPEYGKGAQMMNIEAIIKKMDVKGLFGAIEYKIAVRKMMKYKKPDIPKELFTQVSTYESYLACKQKKIVIYTCITGNYDFLKEPLLEFDHVEYVCFTNHAEEISKEKNSKWKIKKVPEKITAMYNDTLSNRYLKLHPHELFPDADYCIYVDGNIKVISFLGSYLMKTNVATGIAIFAHGQRCCLYDEANTCILRKKGNRRYIEKQVERYQKEGFPKHFGLYECTILATDLRNTNSKKIFDAWWAEFLDSKSLRDQLSLPYVVWKNGFAYHDIGLLGVNIFDDSKITVYDHR